MPVPEPLLFPPTLAAVQDSSKFSTSLEDKTVKGDIEGGYTHARPRTTRKPRRTFKTGFTDISQSLLDTLDRFYEEVGGYKTFLYTHPARNTEHRVRIDGVYEAKYVGIGGRHAYDVSELIMIEE